ncbi:hypothetical protein HN51_010999 [Arachis hypogaea]
MAEAHAKGDALRVIKAAGEMSRPMRLPIPNGLLPKGSNHLYVTVADGSNHSYKIACTPNGWKEITLVAGCGKDVSVMTPATKPPQAPRKCTTPTQAPRRRMGCINVPRSSAAAEVEQTFQSEHPFFIMHITKRLLGIHFLPNVPHFGDDVNDDAIVNLRAGEISVQAVYGRYVGKRRRNCGSISQGWGVFLRKCNITVPKLAVFEISRTQPEVELLVQFVDFE